MPSLFDELPAVYEAMIDWPKRLAHEESFYRHLFERIGARRIADVRLRDRPSRRIFHSLGLSVEASDISPTMLDRARALHGEPEGLRWIERSFTEPLSAETPYDAVFCIGNSLVLVPDEALIATAIQNMLAAIRPGGAVVVHILNIWSLPDGPCVWQKTKRITLEKSQPLIVKGVHRVGTRGFVELLVIDLSQEKPAWTESVPFWGLEAEQLEKISKDAGAREVHFFGNHKEDAYRREKSVDLILVAEK